MALKKTTKGPKFAYKGRTAEQAKKRESESSTFAKLVKPGLELFKMKEGTAYLRILPPTWKNYEHYGYDVWIHENVGPESAKQRFLCLQKHKGTVDPIDEERRQADADGETEYAKSLLPRRRIGVWVIDRDEEKKGPQFWLMPVTVDKDIMIQSENKRTGELILVEHPDEGFDIEVTRQGSGLTTKYYVKVERESSALHEDTSIGDKWLEFVVNNPVPDCLNFYSYDHIQSVFTGGVPDSSKESDKEDDEDEEDEEEETNNQKEDEEEDKEDEDEDEEDEDENDPPFDSDDDEEDDEDEKELERLKARLAKKNKG